MNTQSLTQYAATASPAQDETIVSFMASIDFNNQTIPINTGDIRKGLSNLKFSLTDPVALGSIDDFFDFVGTTLDVPLSSPLLTTYIDDLPSAGALGALRNGLLSFLTAPVSIEVLNVDVAANSFAVGIGCDIQLQLTSFLKLNSLGVTVTRAPSVTGSPG